MILEFFRAVPPFLASLSSILSICFSFFVPWSYPNFLEDESEYQIFLPTQLGLTVIFEGETFEENIRPFIVATTVAVIFLAISAIVSCTSIFDSLISYWKDRSIRSDKQNLLLILALASNSLAVGSYVLVTASHMNGGYYSSGVWLNAFIILIGLFCSLISTIADTEIRRNNYLRNLRIAPKLPYMSIDRS